MQIFWCWLLPSFLAITGAMQLLSQQQRNPVAMKKFRQMALGIACKIERIQPQHLPEGEGYARAFEIFKPLFHYLMNLYPDPYEEAELLVRAYIEAFKTIPPKELIQPLIEDALKHGERGFCVKLAIFLEKMEKELQKIDSNENLGAMKELIEDFAMDPNARQDEILAIFPDHEDVDQALLSSIKGVLLSRTVLEKGIKEVRTHLLRLFDRPELKKNIFETTSKLFGHYYGYNYLIRMMEEARRNKANNAETLLRIYALASSLLMVECYHYKLPAEICRKFRETKFKSEKERSFVRWRLANYNHKIRMESCPLEYRFAAEYLPVHELILFQVMFNLEKFIDPKDVARVPENERSFLPEWSDFRDKNFEATIAENTASATVLKIFNNRMDKVVPEATRSNPKYRMFEALSQDDIDRILAPTVEQIEQTKKEQSFFDFKVEKDGKKKGKKRKQTMSMEISEPVFEGEVENPGIPASLQPELKLPENDAEPSVSIPMEVVDENEDLKGKEGVKQVVDEEELIKEEIEEMMRIQDLEIQMFKKLKKQNLDLARARRSKVNVVVERQATQKKSRMVAFLHTDDLRLINEKANELYLKNTVEDSGRTNIILGNGQFKWIFNPKIVIDFDGYQFLCQVFNVVDGKARLTYEMFLKTFSKLNPIKANAIQRRSKALNRTVFQFDHAFECENAIYVPPIGGAHREHLSSRFNHHQIRKFLMHGGCHPYFFERL